MKQLLQRWFVDRTDSAITQFVRYFFVGGVAFVVDFGALAALTELAGLHYLLSATLAFGLGLTTNYLLSISWVFDNRTMENRTAEFVIFGVIGVIGLGMNNLILWLLTDVVIGMHYLVSKLFATGIVFVWNFGARKIVLFRSSGDGDPGPD